MSAPGDQYPADSTTGQDEYKSRPGQTEIPVQSDSAPVEDPIDAETANSDEQLKADDKEAIDQDNVMDSRTRGAKPEGGYTEPGDEEGLPTNDGTSAIAQ